MRSSVHYKNNLFDIVFFIFLLKQPQEAFFFSAKPSAGNQNSSYIVEHLNKLVPFPQFSLETNLHVSLV